MTLATQLTRTQEREFYRNAVLASLEQFYGKSKPEASKLVRDWWKRLAHSGAFASGLYLHSEPMNTAAGIAQAKVVPVTSKNRGAYHRILDESRDLALAHPRPKATVKELEPKKSADSQRQRSISAARP